MPRLSKEIQKAMARADKEVRKQALKPKLKKKVKKKKPESAETRSPSRWLKDEWGEQGEVFFNGKFYWITRFKFVDGVWEARPTALSEEQWEDYKKKPIKSGLPKAGQKSGISGTGEQSSSTQRKTKSTKSSKKKQKKSSRTNNGKTATQEKQG